MGDNYPALRLRKRKHEHQWYYYDLDGNPFPGICMLCGLLKEGDA